VPRFLPGLSVAVSLQAGLRGRTLDNLARAGRSYCGSPRVAFAMAYSQWRRNDG
jgi:hypothetical protein